MTRDEYREKCFEAMQDAYWRAFDWGGIDNHTVRDCLIAAFDALHGIARVDPIEATEEMVKAIFHADDDIKPYGDSCDDCGKPHDEGLLWRAMSAAGDLTNPPEGKP